MRPRTDTQTQTQTRVTTIHFASSTTHAKCNETLFYAFLAFIRIFAASNDVHRYVGFVEF